jgi:hypothetical protein
MSLLFYGRVLARAILDEYHGSKLMDAGVTLADDKLHDDELRARLRDDRAVRTHSDIADVATLEGSAMDSTAVTTDLLVGGLNGGVAAVRRGEARDDRVHDE